MLSSSRAFCFLLFLGLGSGGGDANLAKSAIKYECGLVLLLSTGWANKLWDKIAKRAKRVKASKNDVLKFGVFTYKQILPRFSRSVYVKNRVIPRPPS